MILTKDKCPSGDNSPSYYDGKCGEKGEEGEKEPPRPTDTPQEGNEGE